MKQKLFSNQRLIHLIIPLVIEQGLTILVGMAISMLGLAPSRIKVANMLPAIFLPVLYFPLAELVGKLL